MTSSARPYRRRVAVLSIEDCREVKPATLRHAHRRLGRLREQRWAAFVASVNEMIESVLVRKPDPKE